MAASGRAVSAAWLAAQAGWSPSSAASAPSPRSASSRKSEPAWVSKVAPTEAENTSIQIENAQDVSQDAQDVSPLGAQRAWVQQAEDNVIERLFQAGILDAPSDFDNEAIWNTVSASTGERSPILRTPKPLA